MMLLVAACVLVWLAVLVLVLAICRSAAVGDAAQHPPAVGDAAQHPPAAERTGRFAPSGAPLGARRPTRVP